MSRATDAGQRAEIDRLSRKYGSECFPQPPGRLARFLARSWPLRPIADWVYSVTNAVLAEKREEARIQALWDAPTDSEIRELVVTMARAADSAVIVSDNWPDGRQWPTNLTR